MVNLIKEAQAKLLCELEKLDDLLPRDLFFPDQRLILIEETIGSLKDQIVTHEFSETSEEISFYKAVLPPLLSIWIYYSEKSGLETSEQIGTRNSKKEYKRRLENRIDEFLNDNMDFYEYCSRGETHLDGFYFLRSGPSRRQPVFLFDTMIDPRYCPAYCCKVAMIMAYKKLDDELSLLSAERESDKSGAAGNNYRLLKWTGSTIELVELSYALVKGGYFGSATLKDVIETFQFTFQKKLGNYTKKYQEMLSRKKGTTTFLTKLTSDFEKWIDETE